jgi:hypothetical protein
MNKVKKLLLLVFSAALMLVLTACGGKVETELNIKEGFSGSRVMTYSANLADNKQYFKGSVDEITETVAENTPAELVFSDLSTDTDAIYEFKLNFSSEEEYQKKVTALLDAGGVEVPDPLYELTHPDSIFASGVKYRENFNSIQLLMWFSNLLVENGYVTEGNQSDIFYNGQTGTWMVYGEKNTNGTQADVDAIKYLTLNGVDMYTKINNDGTYDREIRVRVPKSSMNEKGDDIKSYLASVTDPAATGEWMDEDEQSTYIIKATAVSDEKLNQVMNTFYGKSGEKIVTVSNGSGGKVDGSKTFADTRKISEDFALENYVTGWDNTLNFNYYVARKGTYEGELKSDHGNGTLYATDSDNTEWYRLFNSYYDYQFKLEYEYTYKYSLADATVTLKPTFNGVVEREVKLTYSDLLSDSQLETLESRLNSSVDEANGNAVNASVNGTMTLKKCESDGTNLVVILKTKADEGVESALWTDAFGGNNKLLVTRSSNAIMPITQTMRVEDQFDMAMFTDGQIPVLSYTVKGIGNTTKHGEDPAHQKGSNFVEEYTDYYVSRILSHDLTGTKVGIIPIVLICVGALALLATAGLIVMMILKKNKANAPAAPFAPVAAQPAMQPVVQPAAPVQAEMPAQPAPVAQPTPAEQSMAPVKFCTQCGAKITDGRAFCTQCGNKLS